ncbi:recombinase family protein [Sphingopyxis sp. SE2]|uniref:recombinase family protein n=1 Tax=Sphingopyxis sp. SE2 TaxID=1586240 RepID=UPI0028C2EF2C|nr:recombinase family protein [Sphingopyxis sp. SE2]MDT7529579.1 recombinase family protein [Sphingopyxis sp. SE2]
MMRHAYPMPKLYSYTRFSTAEQGEGDSERRQMQAAAEFAAARGLELDEALKIADFGVSGYRLANLSPDAGLGKFMEAVRAGLVEPGSMLLLESLDRFSRAEPVDVQHELTGLIRAGIEIATLNDGRVYSRESLARDNGLGLMISLMVAIRAHEESKAKGDRVAAAWEEKRRKVRAGETKRLTKRAPAWLIWDAKAETWGIDNDKAETVRKIFQWALEGQGEHKIVARLNREGIPTLGRGEQWGRSSVGKILRNRAVIGELIPGRIEHHEGRKRRVLEEPVKGVFPVIISDADWNAVAGLKDGHAPAPKGRGALRPLANLLGGLARCPVCGSAMTRVVKGKKGGAPKLVCTRAKAGNGCVYRAVPLAAVEAVILGSGADLLANIPAGDAESRLDARALELESNIAGTLEHMRDLGDALEASPSKAGAARLAKLERELETLHDALVATQEQRRLVDGGLITARTERLYDALEAGISEGREGINTLLRVLFDSVTVDYVRRVLVFRWRQGGETEIPCGFGDLVN